SWCHSLRRADPLHYTVSEQLPHRAPRAAPEHAPLRYSPDRSTSPQSPRRVKPKRSLVDRHQYPSVSCSSTSAVFSNDTDPRH
ncbi:Fer-1-like protein 6, partial [Clarias magur]